MDAGCLLMYAISSPVSLRLMLTNRNLIRNTFIKKKNKHYFKKMLLLGLEPWSRKRLWFQKPTAGLSRLNDFTHSVAVRKTKSNHSIHASNQNAVFEINPGHFKRPFQEPRHGTDSSLALPDHYLPTFLR